MRTENLAQGLASLGRNGDSMMVHMNPEEVLGLQNLAVQNGTSLTINPDTGMPEAFSLGGVFKSLIPTAIGGGLTAMGLSPLAAGLLVGGGTALFTGDPLEGVLAGFGGYGGGQLANSVKNFGMSQAAGLSDDAASFGAEALAGTADDLGTGAGLASGLDPKDVMGVGTQKGSFGVDLASTGADDLIGAGQTFGSGLAGHRQNACQNRIDRRRGEDITANRCRQHALADKPGMGRFVPGPAARYQRHFRFVPVAADNDFDVRVPVKPCQSPITGAQKPINGFGDKIFLGVDELGHIGSPQVTRCPAASK